MDYFRLMNEEAKELQKKWKLTDYEALQIAVQSQRNYVITEAFGVKDLEPNSLDRISIALEGGGLSSIADSLVDVGVAISSLKNQKEKED